MKGIAVVLIAAALLPSQAADGGWAHVQQLTAGTSVSVTYVDGRSEARVVEGAGPTQLMLRTTDQRSVNTEIVARERILRIALERRHRSPAGAIVGAVGGFLLGLASSGSQCRTAGCALGIGFVDALLGSLLGHGVSRAHVTLEVIYRANHLAPDSI
jgi:hypothetical protein